MVPSDVGDQADDAFSQEHESDDEGEAGDGPHRLPDQDETGRKVEQTDCDTAGGAGQRRYMPERQQVREPAQHEDPCEDEREAD
jgi:hypothetical protein